MKNIVYIAASMDGYIADPEGKLDWLMNIPNPEKSDYGFADFMDSMDGIIMGRKTFEVVLSFGDWPYNKKVFVLSKTLQSIPKNLEGKVEILNGEIESLITDLNNRGFENLYIDGGKTIQSFLALDLIDEMIITRASVILGGGIPLFGRLTQAMNFEVLSSEKLNDRLVKTHYKRFL